MICLPAQTGQPFPRLVRDSTLACHSWPLSQRHHTLRLVPAVRSSGVRLPFRVGCHWAASSGRRVARSFSPSASLRLAQTGQPQPFTLVFTSACHSWPFSQRHHTFRWLPGSTSLGVSAPFLVGCHWAASSGHSVAKSVSPGHAMTPLQKGQPVWLLVLLVTSACHSWPFPQRHHTFFLLP